MKCFIGVTGHARAGKDTAAQMIADRLDGCVMSFAYPIKEAAGIFFGFTERQLYGEWRDAVDPRFSSTSRWRLIRWWQSWRRRDLYRVARAKVHIRLDMHGRAWLREILPTGVHVEFALEKLQDVIILILGHRDITPRMVLQYIGTEFGRALDPQLWVRIALERQAPRFLAQGAKAVVISDVRFPNEGEAIKALSDGFLIQVTRPNWNGGTGGAVGIKCHESEAHQVALGKMAHVIVPNTSTLDEFDILIRMLAADLKNERWS